MSNIIIFMSLELIPPWEEGDLYMRYFPESGVKAESEGSGGPDVPPHKIRTAPPSPPFHGRDASEMMTRRHRPRRPRPAKDRDRARSRAAPEQIAGTGPAIGQPPARIRARIPPLPAASAIC